MDSFAKLVKILPEPCLLVNGEGKILTANRSFGRVFPNGYSELQTLFEISSTPKENLRAYLNNCSRSGQVVLGAIELRNSEGRQIAFRCEGAVLEPASENSEALIFLRLKAKESASSMFRVLTEKIEELNKEVTERLRAEEQSERLYREAQEANRIKDEFLATVSHELRTPLNAILGWTQMLKSGKLDEATFNKALETIERNARSQTQLTEDLLEVSRIISGKLRLDVQPVDLTKSVAAAVDSLRPTAENKSIRLEVVLDPRAGIISGDPERIQQVMWNLVSNAIKFTPKNGRVQVRVERVNSHIEVTVSDTGEGISPEFLPFVFDRFRQSDSSKSRQHGGLGLGLAIVRHLVELHGGSVSVKSEGVGKGAAFTIKLPTLIVREDSISSVETFPRRHPTTNGDSLSFDFSGKLKSLHILVVDDEPDARELLKVILEQCDARVSLASSAAEVLEMIERVDPDIFISDIEMPFENGYSLIQKIRRLSNEKLNRIPAVALTAHARTEDRLQAFSFGFDSHLAKPFEPAELIVMIQGLARRVK